MGYWELKYCQAAVILCWSAVLQRTNVSSKKTSSKGLFVQSDGPISDSIPCCFAKKLKEFYNEVKALQDFQAIGRVHHWRDSCRAKYRVEIMIGIVLHTIP